MASSGNSYDFIVLGVGSMGSAACFSLAKRGFKVLGLERFSVHHDRGAHSGHTRLIRKAYYEHSDYIPLLERAYGLWDELSESTGERVFERTGLLYAGPADDGLLSGVKTSAREYGIEVQVLEESHARARFPQFRFAEGSEILFEPDAGFLRTGPAIRGFVSEALRHGAEIREGQRVIRWAPAGDAVEVETETGIHRAAKIVLTAGPWAASMVPGVSDLLRVTAQTLAWFDVEEPAKFHRDVFPCWAVIDRDSPGMFYGFPFGASGDSGEPSGIKVAHHFPGAEADPDLPYDMTTAGDTALLKDFVGHCFPDAGAALGSVKTCFYSNSPDGHFVIDNIPGFEKYACAAWGFSGHGFKFAPVVGEILADLAVHGATEHPVSFLASTRFGGRI